MNNKIFTRILAWIIFLVISSGAAVYAQESKRIVREIEISNNKVVSSQSILSKLQTKTGQEFSSVILSDDIKRLYATGLFNDVSADLVDAEAGVKVVFRIVEKPILEEIVYKGNRRIRTKRLKSKVQIKTGEIFDQFKLKDDIEKLKSFYEEKGFSLINIKYTKEEKDNKVTITILIDEGSRMRIRGIDFKGNSFFNDKRLTKLLKTRKRWILSSGYYKKDVLDDDTDRILGFYYSEGFVDAKVDLQLKYDQAKSSIFVTFEIEEGRQYKVGKVSFLGNKVFANEKLGEGLLLSKENVYSENKLREDISKIQTHYFDEGYISSNVRADTVLNPDTGLVDISYDVSEGGVAYVDQVNVQGNTRTKDVIIRREMRLYPGDRYNGEKLKRSRQRLNNLGYFEEVTMDTPDDPTTQPDKYDLDVYVKESKTGEFSFGAGYSSVDKFIGFVDLTQRNFDLFNFPTFTGGGQKLRVRTEFGSERRDYELSFLEPWFLGYPVRVGFDLYSRTRDWDKYDEERNGGDIYVGRDFGEYWSGKLSYRYEGIDIDDVAVDASRDIRNEAGKNYISSLTHEIVHDSRDDIYETTKGSYNVVSCEVAGDMFGGDKDFIKYYTRDSQYFPVTEDSVLELKMRAGLVEAYSDTADVPIYERFYAGGANTIRGYKERRVGPEGEFGDPIGGRVMGIFNVEYTYGLTKNLKWAFFYDIGKIWANMDELDWDNLKLRSSIGTGMRVKTPLGPIKLDYGYALNRREGDAKGRFHFSMSHEF